MFFLTIPENYQQLCAFQKNIPNQSQDCFLKYDSFTKFSTLENQNFLLWIISKRKVNKIYLRRWLAPAVARTSQAPTDPARSSRIRAGRGRGWVRVQSSSKRPRRTWMTAGTPSRRRRRWRASSRLALTRGLFSRTLLYSVAARPYVCTHTWYALWSTCTQVKPAVPTSGITYPRNQVAWSIARAYLHTFHCGHNSTGKEIWKNSRENVRNLVRVSTIFLIFTVYVLLYRLLGGGLEGRRRGRVRGHVLPQPPPLSPPPPLLLAVWTLRVHGNRGTPILNSTPFDFFLLVSLLYEIRRSKKNFL